MANKLFSFFKQGSNTYEVKDAQARTDITTLNDALVDTTKATFTSISLPNVSQVTNFTVPESRWYLLAVVPSGTNTGSVSIYNSSSSLIAELLTIAGAVSKVPIYLKAGTYKYFSGGGASASIQY